MGRRLSGGSYHSDGGGAGGVNSHGASPAAGKQAYWNTEGGGRKPTNNNNRDNINVRDRNSANTFSPQGGAAAVGENGGRRSSNGNAKAFLTSSFAQHSQRRRIEFHAATKPSTVFSSPSASGSLGLGKGGGGVGSGAKKGDGRRDRETKQDGTVVSEGSGGKKGGVGGGVLALVRMAEEKIGLPPDGKVISDYIPQSWSTRKYIQEYRLQTVIC